MNTFRIDHEPEMENLLRWSEQFTFSAFLNSNSSEQLFSDPYSSYDWLLAVGKEELLLTNVFTELKTYMKENNDWLFGYFGYDLKNQLEKLQSNKENIQKSKDHFFFRPLLVIYKNKDGIYISGEVKESDIQKLIDEINFVSKPISAGKNLTEIKALVQKEEYISNVRKLKEHIQRGDIYEINYCIGFVSENFTADPIALYMHLNQLSPMPFSAYIRNQQQYVLCASPERFLAGRGKKMISQPIKGTARRGKNEEEDELIRAQLFQSEKERSENVMIVDLVRNDLSRTAARGTVKVEELFGIKTFRMLHQMISTVVSERSDKAHNMDVIAAAFPMGSMTGAPKVRAMELIEEFENSGRGIYSGAIGYFAPVGNFDFNVVIRSLFYNSDQRCISFMVGSAITINADPEAEYEECLLKASAMMKVLSA